LTGLCRQSGRSAAKWPTDPICNPGGAANQWIYGDMFVSPGNINPDMLRVGLMFPYAPNVAIYKCPADKLTIGGTPTIRSMSMNAYMNPLVGNSVASAMPATTPPGPLNAVYRMFKRQNDISVLGDAN
jgi:hypothetical protein